MISQNLSAEAGEWTAKARAAGPGYRVWRWEEAIDRDPGIVFKHRLLAPDEEPDGLGAIIYP